MSVGSSFLVGRVGEREGAIKGQVRASLGYQKACTDSTLYAETAK